MCRMVYAVQKADAFLLPACMVSGRTQLLGLGPPVYTVSSTAEFWPLPRTH